MQSYIVRTVRSRCALIMATTQSTMYHTAHMPTTKPRTVGPAPTKGSIMEQDPKYPLSRVQALVFKSRKEAIDFVEKNAKRIVDKHVQSINPGHVVMLFIWRE